MKKARLSEYFTESANTLPYGTFASVPPRLFPQERDWTCSVACIRTLLSALTADVPSEDWLIEKHSLVKGPHFVDEIVEKGFFPPKTNLVTHKDYPPEKRNLHTLTDLLSRRFFIMTESLINYDHWVVVLGYFAVARCFYKGF